MVENWADVVADRIAGVSPLRKGKSSSSDAAQRAEGTLLLLGAADTGKTTVLDALVKRLARRQPVAVVDADIGQSHLGPPTTIGWTVRARSTAQAAELWPHGIAFVGDITPMGHLLQWLAALALCVERARQAARTVLIDTPGLVAGPAACSLWWTVQRLLRPERIVALQRQNELDELLKGLQADLSAIELVAAPPKLRHKSPAARQEHRRRLFEEYFREATAYTLDLKRLAVRFAQRVTAATIRGRIVGLTDAAGEDMALGVIERWRSPAARMTIRAPQLDIRRVRCLTIGDTRIDWPVGWSG